VDNFADFGPIRSKRLVVHRLNTGYPQNPHNPALFFDGLLDVINNGHPSPY
jgi:hypothetical protein